MLLNSKFLLLALCLLSASGSSSSSSEDSTGSSSSTNNAGSGGSSSVTNNAGSGGSSSVTKKADETPAGNEQQVKSTLKKVDLSKFKGEAAKKLVADSPKIPTTIDSQAVKTAFTTGKFAKVPGAKSISSVAVVGDKVEVILTASPDSLSFSQKQEMADALMKSVLGDANKLDAQQTALLYKFLVCGVKGSPGSYSWQTGAECTNLFTGKDQRRLAAPTGPNQKKMEVTKRTAKEVEEYAVKFQKANDVAIKKEQDANNNTSKTQNGTKPTQGFAVPACSSVAFLALLMQ